MAKSQPETPETPKTDTPATDTPPAPAIDVAAIRESVIKTSHPAANLFPMMSDDEFANLVLSIKQHGFDPEYPISRVKGEKGELITDGRNREAAVRVVNAEIELYNAANPTDQKPLVEAVYIPDKSENDADVLQHVLMGNFTRRHLSSGQKAAVLVKSGILSTHYEKAKELAGIGKRVAQDVAALVAGQHGVNRDYLLKAKAIAKLPKGVGKKLLEAVCSGEMSLMAAWAEMKKVGDGTGKEGDGGSEPEAGEEIILDGKKERVDDEFADIFRVRAKFAHVAKLLREAKSAMKEIAADEKNGGALLAEGNNLKEATQGISQTAKALRNCEPHVVCPHCEGTGKHPEKGGRHKCPACAGLGWMSEPQFEAFEKFGPMGEQEEGEEGEGDEGDGADGKPKKKPAKKGKSVEIPEEEPVGTTADHKEPAVV